MVGKTTNTKANTFSGFFTAIHSFVMDAAKLMMMFYVG